jgi:uncharacterized protein (DUF4415 family)
MIASEKLTPERIAEIKAFKNTDFSDCPKLTRGQLSRMKPRNQEAFEAAKQAMRIELDADVFLWLRGLGADCQTEANGILRRVMEETA